MTDRRDFLLASAAGMLTAAPLSSHEALAKASKGAHGTQAGSTDATLQAAWQSLVRRLESRDLIGGTSLPPSHELNMEACRYMFSQLAHSYIMVFQSDPDYPRFLPYTNDVINFAGPNPDGVYYFTSINGKASYIISGKRNTVHYVDLQTGYGMWGFPTAPGKTFPSSSLDDFKFDADGSFEILLATKKPDGFEGNWMPLNPQADYILVRQVAYDWAEQDARLAIERIDAPLPRPERTAAETERRLNALVEHFNAVVDVFPHMRKRASGDAINRFNSVTYGVGSVTRQVYLQGAWKLKPGEALLCEVKPPEPCFFWNVQVGNMFWETFEYGRRLSSTNGRQARVDNDGMVRVVFTAHDPGVANWIDTAGQETGDIVWRWLRCATPEVSHRVVALDRLNEQLPADVIRVTPEQRREHLRRRSTLFQLRRNW